MSTSPSWFDQEKFSRLVKKVGTRPLPETAPGQPGAESENQPISGEGIAPTARISLVSKPPSLLAEHRGLPALPRRTAPMPSLKALFPSSAPARHPQAPGLPSTEAPPVSERVKDETSVPPGDVTHDADVSQEGDELAEVWHKMGQLNEELARAIHERDQAINEGNLLREQLLEANEKSKGVESAAASTEELARVTEERNQSRHEYAALRKEFESYKQVQQGPKEESAKFRKELEQQLEGFRQKLEDRNRELAALKANSGGTGGGDEKLKEEVASLREQLVKAKEESSIARRGLALSQRALHETRDTLREATEGTSLSRHNFDNLKSECATLAQQNTVLQAQNDQLSRELGAAKSKLTTRL